MQQKNKPFELGDVRMHTRELADGVYAVMAADVDDTDHTATNAGFAVGDSGVLVVESLSNGRLASQVISAVRTVTSLPIRFLVNTSFHGDHCFGNFAFPSQTVIIHHEATKRAIDERFEQDRAFMIDLLGPNVGIEEVVARSADVAVSGPCSLDLGGKHVDIDHIGFAQTTWSSECARTTSSSSGTCCRRRPRHSRGCWRGEPTRPSPPTGAFTRSSTTAP
ncbi:MBL fold metallo-hydrolase [Streptomyces sp. NBC_00510]